MTLLFCNLLIELQLTYSHRTEKRSIVENSRDAEFTTCHNRDTCYTHVVVLSRALIITSLRKRNDDVMRPGQRYPGGSDKVS